MVPHPNIELGQDKRNRYVDFTVPTKKKGDKQKCLKRHIMIKKFKIRQYLIRQMFKNAINCE